MGDYITDRMPDEKELRKALQAARASNAQYEQAVSMISDIIWRYDVNTKGEHVGSYISPVADRMLGLPIGTIGNSFEKYFSYVHPDDLPVVQEMLSEGIRTFEKDKTVEYRMLKADGTTLWVHSKGSAYSRFRVYGTTSDITERKRAEEALRQEKERAHLYLDIVGTIIIAISSNHTISLVNLAGCRLLGYPEDEIIGTNWFSRFLPARARADVEEIFDQLMAGIIEPVRFVEGTVLTRNGEERIVSWHNTILRDEAGNITGALSSGEDITERKKAEEKIASSEALLNATLDSIPDIVGIQNPDHTIVRYNRAGYEFLNLSAKEVQGRRCYELIGRNLPCEECATEKALKTKRLEQTEKYLPEYGVYLDCRSNPVLNEEGEITFIVEQLRDITEFKRAEETLRESEERFRTIFEDNSAAMAIIERDTTISKVNREYCRLGHFEEKDVIGISWTSQIPPEDLGRLLEYNRKRLIDPKSAPDKYEFMFYRKDGKIRHSLMSVAMIPTSQQIVCSFTDITERKQAEEALRESEKKYRLLIDNVSESIIVAQDGLLKFVNLATLALLEGEYSEQELIDRPFPQFIHPDDRSMVVENYRRRIANEAAPSRYAFRVVTREGIVKWVEINGALIEWQGKPATLNILTDITERKRMVEALRKSEERYRRLSEDMPVFVSTFLPDGAVTYLNEMLATWRRRDPCREDDREEASSISCPPPTGKSSERGLVR